MLEEAGVGVGIEVGICGAIAASLSMLVGAAGEVKDGSAIERLSCEPLARLFCSDGVTSSSQVNINLSNLLNYESSTKK